MRSNPSPAHRRTVRLACRSVSALAVAAALVLGVSACGGDPPSDSEPGSSEVSETPEVSQTPETEEPTEDEDASRARLTQQSVRDFYGRVVAAYRASDTRQLCAMTEGSFAEALVEEFAASGFEVSTCRDMWRTIITNDPSGYRDRLSKLEVTGRTATFRSGDDPWRVRLVDDEIVILETG